MRFDRIRFLITLDRAIQKYQQIEPEALQAAKRGDYKRAKELFLEVVAEYGGITTKIKANLDQVEHSPMLMQNALVYSLLYMDKAKLINKLSGANIQCWTEADMVSQEQEDSNNSLLEY